MLSWRSGLQSQGAHILVLLAGGGILYGVIQVVRLLLYLSALPSRAPSHPHILAHSAFTASTTVISLSHPHPTEIFDGRQHAHNYQAMYTHRSHPHRAPRLQHARKLELTALHSRIRPLRPQSQQDRPRSLSLKQTTSTSHQGSSPCSESRYWSPGTVFRVASGRAR